MALPVQLEISAVRRPLASPHGKNSLIVADGIVLVILRQAQDKWLGLLPANRATSAQSPRIMASFFFRLQPLIWRSRPKASPRDGNSSENTSVTGRLLCV